jgi:hypothetical protein
MDMVAKLKRLKKCGVDLFAAEHLKLFMGSGTFVKANERCEPDEKQFAEAYTKLVNIALKGELPSGIRSFFSSNLLLALPKSANDIRPIGIGTLLRKVTSKFVENAARDEVNGKIFEKFQHALRRGGMEEIIHSINLFRSKHPKWDVFGLDADNSFNSANKFIGLSQVLRRFPKAFSFVHQMYFHQSNQFFFAQDGEIRVIPAVVGLHQGDVLGTWMFIMTIQPLLEGLMKHLEELFPVEADEVDGFNGAATVGEDGEDIVPVEPICFQQLLSLFFVDDGYFCGPSVLVQTAIKYINAEGERFGFKIKAAI